jgi:hypothetical protein
VVRLAVVKVRALLVAVAAALTFSAVALAGQETTAPTKKVTVLVVITDKGISLHTYVAIGSESDLGANLAVLKGPVPRGDYLSFNVYNQGKKPHSFAILGKKTPAIKPGHKVHLFTTATTRGNFLYHSPLDESKSFRGYLAVF